MDRRPARELLGRLLVMSVSRRGRKSVPNSNHTGTTGMFGNRASGLMERTILGYDPTIGRSVLPERKGHAQVRCGLSRRSQTVKGYQFGGEHDIQVAKS